MRVILESLAGLRRAKRSVLPGLSGRSDRAAPVLPSQQPFEGSKVPCFGRGVEGFDETTAFPFACLVPWRREGSPGDRTPDLCELQCEATTPRIVWQLPPALLEYEPHPHDLFANCCV